MILNKILILLLLSTQVYAQSPQQIFWSINKPRAGGVAPDADSINFVTKVVNNGGSLSSTEKTAIGTLIKKLKDSSLWTLMKAVYPMVGASAASCKVNLKDTVNYNLTFVASPTFASTGVDWNGTTQYATTGLNPLTVMATNAHISYYSRENVNTAADQIDMGSTDATTSIWVSCYYNASGLTTSCARNTSNSVLLTGTNATAAAFFSTSNTASTGALYKNGVSLTTAALTSTLPNMDIDIGASNRPGSPAFFTNRECAFASIGFGLTAAQSLTLYNIVQAFQTTLSRQV